MLKPSIAALFMLFKSQFVSSDTIIILVELFGLHVVISENTLKFLFCFGFLVNCSKATLRKLFVYLEDNHLHAQAADVTLKKIRLLLLLETWGCLTSKYAYMMTGLLLHSLSVFLNFTVLSSNIIVICGCCPLEVTLLRIHFS